MKKVGLVLLVCVTSLLTACAGKETTQKSFFEGRWAMYDSDYLEIRITPSKDVFVGQHFIGPYYEGSEKWHLMGVDDEVYDILLYEGGAGDVAGEDFTEEDFAEAKMLRVNECLLFYAAVDMRVEPPEVYDYRGAGWVYFALCKNVTNGNLVLNYMGEEMLELVRAH